MSATRSGPLGVLGLAMLALSPAIQAQTALGRTPNLRPAWTLGAGQTALRIGHRFEFLAGGDELLNIPTLSLGLGLGRRLGAGIDFTSNSEVVPDRLGGNEAQPWLAAPVLRGRRGELDLTAAWNSAAASADASATATLRTGALVLGAELRGFTNAAAGGDAGAAATVGVLLRLTPLLEVGGDLGRGFAPGWSPSVWSAGLAVAIPGSPHTLSLHATNGGATTLQGATRRRVLGDAALRYGFVFTVPLGSGRQWARIFRRAAPEATRPEGADAVVELRQVALHPVEIRIRAGQTVAWVNHDPLVHTVTADDGAWDSGVIPLQGHFLQRFERPGRYSYHCLPHPQMRGVVIVE